MNIHIPDGIVTDGTLGSAVLVDSSSSLFEIFVEKYVIM
jgi:hypothetical protein